MKTVDIDLDRIEGEDGLVLGVGGYFGLVEWFDTLIINIT